MQGLRVFLSATNVDNGQKHYLSNTCGQRLAVEHVLASGSFPGGFPLDGDRGRR